MVMSIQAKRDEKNELARQARDLLANKGDRIWTAAEQKQFDSLADRMEECDRDINNIQRVMDEHAEENFQDVDQFKIDPKNKVQNERRKLYDRLLREGPSALTRDELMSIRDTTSTGTPAQGGYTVESSVATQLIDSLKAYGGMREVASQITTTQGNALSYPTSDGTAEEGEWVPENTAASSQDPTFGTAGLNAFKASSKIITIPIELLMDSSIDIIALVNKRIRDRLGRTFNRGFTTGTGTGQPTGWATAASVGKVGATGQTVTITYEDLVDLLESIDEAYQLSGDCRWQMHQQMRKVVRKLKDGSGRPIWADSYESGIKTGVPSQLLGKDVQINNDMAVPGANAKSLGFGDYSKYMIRDVLQLLLHRFEDSVYASKGQVGFLAFARAGGNLLDVNAVKSYQHPAT